MCQHCKKETKLYRIKRSFYEKHVSRRTEKKYQCSGCGHVFYSKVDEELKDGFIT